MFRKPGILLRTFSHRATNFRPNILVTNTPVISMTSNTKIIPEPGIVVSKLNRASGRYFCGIRLLTSSKKNLITMTLKARGIQKRRPEIK